MTQSTVPLDDLLGQLPKSATEGLKQNVLDQPDDQPWYRVENKKSDGPAKVYIFDAIGGWFGVSAQEFVNELNDIESKTIELHLNSPGGEMWSGVAIYNALKQHDANIDVYVDGLAASAASFIAQAGDQVFMTRGSTMMIHDASGLGWGNAAELLKTSQILDKLSNSIADIYSNRAGGSAEYWRALMKEEVWYTAQEAVDAKLADSVAGDAEDSQVEDHWNFTVFNYAGRSNAPDPAAISRKVLDRTKETPVTAAAKAAATNSEGGTEAPAEGTPAPAAPAADPANQPSGTPDPEKDTSQDEEAQPTALPPSNTTGGAAGVSFVVAGRKVSNPTEIQQYINGLEQFRDETFENARKSFVENLANDKKILASQVDGLVAFAASLSNEQYAAWTASWDAAPASSVLMPAGSQNNGDTAPGEADANAARIETLKEIVGQHKLGGTKNETIKTYPSYVELMKLDPTFTLD